MADAEREAVATHAEVARSAHRIEQSAAAQLSSADRTTQLAADRTVLAAERTYAAWVRTGLASLAAGIGAKKLLTDLVPAWLASAAGLTLVAFSAFCFAAAVWREFVPFQTQPLPDVPRLSRALLLAVNGVLVLVAAAAFVGLLTAR